METDFLKISVSEISAAKKSLLPLYERELFERQLYMSQILKFHGNITDTLKWLSRQEENHANILHSLIGRAGIKVRDYVPAREFAKLAPAEKSRKSIASAVNFDIEQEKISIQKYFEAVKSETISKSLKSILNQIMEEELVHVGKLIEYSEND
ncbi:MAG: ferritin-like domain-containing protein [archaeon]|jgi:rubrerythrin